MNSRSKAIEAYLKAYFVEVNIEEVKTVKTLCANELKTCDLCSGTAHYDSPIHNEGLAWHYLCEICMSTEGEPTQAIRIIHTCHCTFCESHLTHNERQTVLPF